MTKITPTQALDLKFYSGDLGDVVTIREYLKRLLVALWEEGESFSGKRPFGNSGWQYDLEKPLAAHGVIRAEITVYNETTESYEEVASFDPTDSEWDGEVEALDDIGGFVLDMIGAL